MKTIVTEDLPKRDGERKSKLFLAYVDGEGRFTKLTFPQWIEIQEPNGATEYTKTCFLDALLRQVDRFTLRIDYNKYVMENNHEVSFTQKMRWLLNSGCIYTKRGLTY